jgi:photosystem II stability/assembly factor-like uncharacterized protein
MRHKTLAVTVFGIALLAVLAACGGTYNYGTVSFVDTGHGWVTGFDPATRQTLISRTTDGGATWNVVGTSQLGKSPARVVGPAAFATATAGVWCVGIDTVLFTTTGGDPWQTATITGLDGHYFSAMSFASPTVGYAAACKGAGATEGAVAKTTDGGATWAAQKVIPAAGGCIDVACPTESVSYVLKDDRRGGVWATTDGGLTWTRHRLPGTSLRPVYFAIDFPTDLTGYAVGNAGKIAKTTDGGLTWVAQVSGVRTALRAVCFVDADIGFAVGIKGVILRTLDGGATWVKQASGTTASFNSVDFVSSDEGWAVGRAGWAPGQKGFLLHTTDAGQTWTR